MQKKRFFYLFASLLILALGACSDRGAGNAESLEITPEVVEIEVTRVVEVEVTRVVEIQVPVNDNGTPVGDPIAVPTTAPESLPTPTPRSTPTELGNKGDFDEKDLEKLLDIWELVEDEYYGPLPTDENMTDALIVAMVEELGDPFTNYFNPEQTERINDGFRGDFEGIGAYVNTDDQGRFFIVRPIPDTPAAKAGLKPNDVVTHVDGESIAGYSTDEVVSIVRGPKGEAVVLTILREGTANSIDVTIIRDRIVVPMVVSQTLEDGKIGYVQLVSFNQVAQDQLTEAVEEHVANEVESLILDLRDNGGGLLSAAVGIGDLFLDKGRFLIVRSSDGGEEVYDTRNGQVGEDVPMVVLINNNSASASEIVSAALKERGRATVIGVNTFGKGSVQTPYSLTDGSEFRVTIARFFSPDDNVIHGVGVSPDIDFNHTPDVIGDEDDLTLQRAVEYILTGE